MRRKKLLVLVMILFVGVGLRIGYFCVNPYNMDLLRDDEPWSKINIAVRWQNSNEPLPDLNFGILHTYIISTLWLFNKEEVVLLARLVSLAFGILLLPVYFFLLKEMFDTDIANFGTFFLALYPLHVHLSSVSLTEPIAYFLLFSSLYFLYRFIHRKKVFYLVISAMALNLSCLLRYESWLFIALFTAILFLEYRFLKIFSSTL